MKMYIRIEGDDNNPEVSCEVGCTPFFLKEAIINLFQILINIYHISPALTCLKECNEIMEKKLKEVDK